MPPKRSQSTNAASALAPPPVGLYYTTSNPGTTNTNANGAIHRISTNPMPTNASLGGTGAGAIPRSTSPSGFTQFLTKPGKWFTRSVSGAKAPSTSSPNLAPSESRSSLSSSNHGHGRRHKISRPTDPRPIGDPLGGGGGSAGGMGHGLGGYSGSPSSRSVMDLSTRTQASMDLPRFVPHSPTNPGHTSSSYTNQPLSQAPQSYGDGLSRGRSGSGNALGDLRNISKRGWSRSADDLSQMGTSSDYFENSGPDQVVTVPSGGVGHGHVALSPIKPSFQERILEYRNRSDSGASGASGGSGGTSDAVGIPMSTNVHPFPTFAGSPPPVSPIQSGHQHRPHGHSPLNSQSQHGHQQRHSPVSSLQAPRSPTNSQSQHSHSGHGSQSQHSHTGHAPMGIAYSHSHSPTSSGGMAGIGAGGRGAAGQRSSTLPPLSVSVSTPAMEGQQAHLLHQQQLQQARGVHTSLDGVPVSGGELGLAAPVHTRSHSFTPKLPSRLAAGHLSPTGAAATSPSSSSASLTAPTSASGSASSLSLGSATPTSGGRSFASPSSSMYPSTGHSPISPGARPGATPIARVAVPVRHGTAPPMIVEPHQRQPNRSGGLHPTAGGGNRRTVVDPSMNINVTPGNRRTMFGATDAQQNRRTVFVDAQAIEPAPEGGDGVRKAAGGKEKEPEVDTRRASQILQHSGLVNLHNNPSTNLRGFNTHLHNHHTGGAGDTLNLTSAKAWKPYKLELKGSKLCFYKPPSDKSAGIRELFPQGLVPASEEDDFDDGGAAALTSSLGAALAGIEEDGNLNGSGVDDGEGARGGAGKPPARRKRAYWGRGTHPDLGLVNVSGEGGLEGGEGKTREVVKGPWEALVHEVVFATTFDLWAGSPVSEGDADAEGEAKEQEEAPGEVDEPQTEKAIVETEAESKNDEEESNQTQTQEDEADGHTAPGARTDSEGMKQWKAFTSSMVFTLPSFIDRAVFETELLRCSGYFLSGLDDEQVAQGLEKQRVGWLLSEYLRYWAAPVDNETWAKWKEEHDLEGTVETSTQGVVAPPSASLLHADPGRGTPSRSLNPSIMNDDFWHALPSHLESGQNLPTAKLLSLDPAFVARSLRSFHRSSLANGPSPSELLSTLLSIQTPPISTSPNSRHVNAQSASSTSLDASCTAEDQARANAKNQLRLLSGSNDDPHWLTKFVLIQIFESTSGAQAHASAQNAPPSPIIPPPVSPAHILASSKDKERAENAVTSPAPGIPSLGARRGSIDALRSVAQVQARPPPQAPIPLQQPQQQQQQQQRTFGRPDILAFWTHVAELARMQGDETTWQAVKAALCSRSVARLESVWRRVGNVIFETVEAAGSGAAEGEVQRKAVKRGVIPIIETWTYPAANGKDGKGGGGGKCGPLLGVSGPRVTVWAGDVRARIVDELGKARGATAPVDGPAGKEAGVAPVREGEVIFVEPLHRAKAVFEEFGAHYASARVACQAVNSGETEGEDVKRIVDLWKDIADGGGGNGSGLAVKFQRIDQFLSLSMAAEARRKGMFEPYFWQRRPQFPTQHQQLQQQALPNQALLPVLFPEAMCSQSLIDRSELVRGRVESDPYLRGGANNTNSNANAGGNQWMDLQGGRNRKDFRDHNFSPENTKRMVFGKPGPVIAVYGGELLLMVQAGAQSRPPSSVHESGAGGDAAAEVEGSDAMKPSVKRVPSVRVKPGADRDLSRKTSMARRSSLPSVTHLNNPNLRDPGHPSHANYSNYATIHEASSEPPLRAIVKAGTLDNLVNILVHGLGQVSVSVADDNGEMTLMEGKSRDVVVDKAEFGAVWWRVFRSYVTPFVFFELLRKLYMTAQPTSATPPPGEYVHVATRRNEVLTTMREWLTIGGGAQDILDDTQLYTQVQAFMDGTSDDHVVHKMQGDQPAIKVHVFQDAHAFDIPVVKKVWAALRENHAILKACFAAQMMRPTLKRPSGGPGRWAAQRRAGAGTVVSKHPGSRELPDFERMTAEEFTDNLDGMFCAVFNNVTDEDLYITADLFEVQTSDKTGWFSAREPPSTEDLVEIQTIYGHLQEVEASSLISELCQDSLYRQLPPAIRSCIRAFGILRKWLVAKIVAPRLGLRARQARMELLVQVLEVARMRNAEQHGRSAGSAPSQGGGLAQPCVRSFVEAVVTAVILSVESRMHHRAWQSLALNRGCQCDSIASLLLRPFIQSASSHEGLTVDVGWLLERMLEVIVSSDVLDSSSPEGQPLINFDKRRHLHNLISQAWSLPQARLQLSDEATSRAFERLNLVEKEVNQLSFDHRYIKDEASREASQVGANGPPPSKKVVRPFFKTVALQVDKNRRDKSLRSRLQREKTMEQTRNERTNDMLNRAMTRTKGKPGLAPPTSSSQMLPPKVHRNKKSMSNAFLNFMRPISSAFGADFSPSSGGSSGPTVKKTPAELDFAPSGKPALVVSILDARAAQFINNERSYLFQVETEDGGHYLLQSYSKKEMNKWLETISKVTQSVAQRRLTYLGSSPKPQIADHIHNQPIVPSRDPSAVFGVELEFLLNREAYGEPIAPETVPKIIDECLSEIEIRGLTEVGIYRIAGAASEITALKEAYNRGESPIKDTTDIHAVCDLVKSWFRVLPEPVFPPASYYEVMDAMRIENLDERLLAIRSVVQRLPRPNFDLLRRVSEHLDRVTDYEENNHMTADALAIVFSPNLLRAPQNNFAMILNNMGLSHKLVKAFITHFHAIFDEGDDVDGEVEAHSDEEDYNPPIPEEDEDDEDMNDERYLHDVDEEDEGEETEDEKERPRRPVIETSLPSISISPTMHMSPIHQDSYFNRHSPTSQNQP